MKIKNSLLKGYFFLSIIPIEKFHFLLLILPLRVILINGQLHEPYEKDFYSIYPQRHHFKNALFLYYYELIKLFSSSFKPYASEILQKLIIFHDALNKVIAIWDLLLLVNIKDLYIQLKVIIVQLVILIIFRKKGLNYFILSLFRIITFIICFIMNSFDVPLILIINHHLFFYFKFFEMVV